MMMHPRSRSSRPAPARAGFTLPEVLLASALGAILLTSLATASYSLSQTLAQLEIDSGLSDPAVPVLGVIAREVREAWWIDLDASGNLVIADMDNEQKVYRFDASGETLIADYPDGSSVPVLNDLQDVLFEVEEEQRKREADDPVVVDDVWASQAAFGLPDALVVDSAEELALAFVPELEVGDEQRLSASLDSVSLPLAFLRGSGSQNVSVELYEGRFPGDGVSYGALLGSDAFSDNLLPEASVVEQEDEDDVVLAPTSMVSIPLSMPDVVLEPGVGYVLRLSFAGDSQLVAAAYPDGFQADVSPDVMTGVDGAWTQQPYVVPYDLGGASTITDTQVETVVTRATITITPNGNRPPQARSASVLSQVTAKDEWTGVVPGEPAP